MSAGARQQRACGVTINVIAATGGQRLNDHASHGSGGATGRTGRTGQGTPHDLCCGTTTSSPVSADMYVNDSPDLRHDPYPHIALRALHIYRADGDFGPDLCLETHPTQARSSARKPS